MASLTDDDFLWECAMVQQRDVGTDTAWIVPGKEDMMFSSSAESFILPVYPSLTTNQNGSIEVIISEIREHGIMDTIGGEVLER